MELNEIIQITERVRKVKVVRGGMIKKVKRSTRKGYVVDPKTGKEKKRTSADKIRLSKIQKKASRKRRSKKGISNIKRKKSLRRRTFKS